MESEREQRAVSPKIKRALQEERLAQWRPGGEAVEQLDGYADRVGEISAELMDLACVGYVSGCDAYTSGVVAAVSDMLGRAEETLRKCAAGEEVFTFIDSRRI